MLSIAGKLQMAREATAAIEFLHSQQPTPIVHCDVKSANFLLARSRPPVQTVGGGEQDGLLTLKLADFGDACYYYPPPAAAASGRDGREHEDEEEENLAGTPEWMAPEVIVRDAHQFLVVSSSSLSFLVLLLRAPATMHVLLLDASLLEI